MSKNFYFHIAQNSLLNLRCFCFIALLSISFCTTAQDNCLKALESAENFYSSGRPENVPDILAACLKKGFDKEQKIRAFELIILSHLYLDNELMAAEFMLQLLKFEKEFELTGREPMEFKKLYKAFRTYPVFMIGIHTGGNYSFVRSGRLYSLSNTRRDSMNYQSNIGFQVGLNTDLQIGKHLLLATGLNFSRLNYTFNHNLFDFTRYTLKEKQALLNIPFGIKITTGGKKIKPYVSLGASLDLLLQSDIQISRSFPNNPIVEITGQDINVTAIRRKQNYHIYGGVGFKLKVPSSFLFMEARISNGRLNQVNTNARFNNTELIYRYGHVDNDFILNHISISTGIQYNFYKPKIKEKYYYH